MHLLATTMRLHRRPICRKRYRYPRLPPHSPLRSYRTCTQCSYFECIDDTRANASSRSPPVDAIIGGFGGGFGAVLLLLLAFFVLRRRRLARKKHHLTKSLDEDSALHLNIYEYREGGAIEPFMQQYSGVAASGFVAPAPHIAKREHDVPEAFVREVRLGGVDSDNENGGGETRVEGGRSGVSANEETLPRDPTELRRLWWRILQRMRAESEPDEAPPRYEE
ncbi:hypothetical protein K488DRAFT_72003 [Vararia minispora EC-137]|uniref:Uncharacterized protein n=1 Tax=Vararia minispora EC-137 TaxID=1314806 RepID=A0ACB8QG14_9AGAM|nr:hypothetical protein K488DRAFT_72003 [Vararia minispora EC-137]